MIGNFDENETKKLSSGSEILKILLKLFHTSQNYRKQMDFKCFSSLYRFINTKNVNFINACYFLHFTIQQY